MRIFIAGASGLIGVRLVPLLVSAGRAVLAAGGVVIRYGQLYGPGTFFRPARPPRPGSTSTRRPARPSRRSTCGGRDAGRGRPGRAGPRGLSRPPHNPAQSR